MIELPVEPADERGKRIEAERREKMGPGTSLRSYDTAVLSDDTGVDTGDESLVQQQFGSEADVNTIMERFGLTRTLPTAVYDGVYGDFTGVTDYASAVEQMERAQAQFMALPPEVREKFNNDPGQLVSFVQERSLEDWKALFPEPTAPVERVDPVVDPVL